MNLLLPINLWRPIPYKIKRYYAENNTGRYIVMGKQKVICSLLVSRVKGRFVVGPYSKVNWGLKNFLNPCLNIKVYIFILLYIEKIKIM